MLRPAEDIALYRAEMAAWPGAGELREWQEDRRDWVEANDACRRDILERLRADGPLPSQRAPRHLRGAVARRRVEQQPQRPDAARAHGAARRGRRGRAAGPRPALGPRRAGLPRRPGARRRRGAADPRRAPAARARASPGPARPSAPGRAERRRRGGRARRGRGRPRASGGSTRPARTSRSRGRAALLSPFDRLVHDRKRMAELFEFDYQLEMYKPAAKRRWGYYALPILYGDRLVGKLDATADRDAGVLRVDAVHHDVEFTKPWPPPSTGRSPTWRAGSTWRSRSPREHTADRACVTLAPPTPRGISMFWTIVILVFAVVLAAGGGSAAGVPAAASTTTPVTGPLPRRSGSHEQQAVRPGCRLELGRVTPRGTTASRARSGRPSPPRASGSTAAGRPGSGCPGRP